MAQTIGVVLAGGRGRRLGRPKGEVVLGGSTLADRAARALKPLCGSVLISLARGTDNPAPGFPSVEDRIDAAGPLAGIAAAFDSTGRADLLVLACDYPAVGPSFLRSLVAASEGEHDLVFPVDSSGRDHPLVGLWRRSAERYVASALAEQAYKVAALFPDVTVRRLPAAIFPNFDLAHVLKNVNWPADLEEFG